MFVVRGNSTYVRRYKKPRDPQSSAQLDQRARFAGAIAAWRELGEPDRQRYRDRAKRLRRTGYNLFIGEWVATHGQP